jgi:cell division inhibitor SepF
MPSSEHGFIQSLKKMLMGGPNEVDLEDDDIDDGYDTNLIDYPEPEPVVKTTQKNRKPAVEGGSNLVSFGNHYSGGKKTEMVLSQPKDIEGAASVCTDICNNKACVVSLEGVNHDMAQRIADFIGGAVYAVGGDIQRVSNDIFIAAPASVTVTSDVKNEIKKSGSRFFQWAANPV